MAEGRKRRIKSDCSVSWGNFFCVSFVFRGMCVVLFASLWLSVPVQLIAWKELAQK